jgi:hypothetical protein
MALHPDDVTDRKQLTGGKTIGPGLCEFQPIRGHKKHHLSNGRQHLVDE